MARCSESGRSALGLSFSVTRQAASRSHLAGTEVALLVGVTLWTVGLGTALGLHPQSTSTPVLGLVQQSQVGWLHAGAVTALVSIAGLVAVVAFMVDRLCSAGQERATQSHLHHDAVDADSFAIHPEEAITPALRANSASQAPVWLAFSSIQNRLVGIFDVHMASIGRGEYNR